VVVKWDEKRGFGKVKCADGRELFVHSSYLQQTPMTEGQTVSFEARWNEQKKQHHAVDVGPLESSPNTAQLPDLVGSAKIPQPELIQVDPITLPPDASDRQHLEMLTAQMEQLRKQGLQSQQLLVQNQQLLVQGLFALIQQQSIQNANLERALRALTDRMGTEVAVPDAKETAKLEGALRSRDLEVGMNGIEPARQGEAALDLTDAPLGAADVKVAEERTSSQTSPSQEVAQHEAEQPASQEAEEKGDEAVQARHFAFPVGH